ncbi:MAG TPA: dihydrolipoamide acetyltransferase family protein [Povalibacter sp.]|uniref:dihydrolipoamide acetyltransferase family protein n=1 Tax=Povalibacter sp. TaxID=1962978 RepID=UPI002BE8EE26|nr:dihydrolipoamide acetyltransferase family protein [Povalibacter sp.]HMN46514.1 dihydrolipoamide acetyltransferase family protein [Povalibacter sp.]
MSRYIFKMPDLGEGTVAAEIVACHVKPGDVVKEEQVILDVMTEKATVEVSAPVSGRIVSIAGQPGDSVPVGAELVVFETDAAAAASSAPERAPAPPVVQTTPATAASTPPTKAAKVAEAPASTGGRVMASPATRRRAREAGIELAKVPGSGPGGRISREDFNSFVERRSTAKAPTARPAGVEVEEVPVIGMRRLIAQRMLQTVQTIPHFSYVEEVDVTELESLRQHLNAKQPKGAPSYTYLPFIALALVRILPRFPQCNVRYDSERNVLMRYRPLHLGIATQTPDGLKVPVVRNVEQRSLGEVAGEIRRVSEAARNNKATRDELSGSTLTLTSLGRLGGIASTPIINAPEVSIIGVNNAVERPVIIRGEIAVRRMMNLSSSFDHRFVDGHDAASLIQALKECLEHPAMIFAEI